MAGLPVPDDIFPRRLVRASVAPSAALGAGGGVAVGLLVGMPLAGVVVLGGLGWGALATVALYRSGAPRRRTERIDPFTLQEPWRLYVQAALANRARVNERADSAAPGPLRERLQEIASRVHLAVDESWQVAKRGHTLAKARQAVRTGVIDQQIERFEKDLAEAPGDQRLAEALAAHQAQRTAADRMDEVISSTDAQLRLLDARMGEVVVRAAELSAHLGDAALLDTLSSDVDVLLTEMEALRLALDEVHGAGATQLPPGEQT
jgi:hypothetical protein